MITHPRPYLKGGWPLFAGDEAPLQVACGANTRLYSRREEWYVHSEPAIVWYPIRHLITRSNKVSNPRGCIKCLYRFEIWQASRQLCCRGACRIAERQKIKHRFCAFETLWDLKIRRFMGYWHVPCFIGVLQVLINEICMIHLKYDQWICGCDRIDIFFYGKSCKIEWR